MNRVRVLTILGSAALGTVSIKRRGIMARRLLIVLGIAVFGSGFALVTGTTTALAHSYDFTSCAQVITSPLCLVNTQLPGVVSLPFTTEGDTVTADGFSKLGTPLGGGLFIKNEGPGTSQNGLGIGSQINHEIDDTEFVSLDLSALAAKGITSGTLSIESISTAANEPPGELVQVCNSGLNAAFCTASTFNHTFGANGGQGDPDTWAGTVDWTAGAPFLQISGVINGAADSDVLVDSLVAGGENVSVPEPGSMALIAMGLVGLVFARYRKVF